MYWYYKYPLCVLAALVAFGILYMVWTHLPEDLRARLFPVEEEQTVNNGEEPSDTPPDPPIPNGTDSGGQVVTPPDSGGTSVVSPPAGVTPQPPVADLDPIRRRLKTARLQLSKDNLLAARTLARKALEDPAATMFDELWMEAAEIISEVNTVLANSDAPSPEKIAYVVKEGDNLVKIAYRHRTTVGALQRLNKLDATNPMIYPGNVLHTYNNEWSILVIKARFALLLYHGGELFKLYHVGIGRQNRTPVGTFEVRNKVRHPAWTPPGKHIPFGDPENVLGTHWLGLEPIEGTDVTLKGYGIHGTWQPESIGTAASQGCVRMRNEEVGELFDLVPVGVRVVIKDE